MSGFVDNNNKLENEVLQLIDKEHPLTQENIAKELNNDLKNDLCSENFGTDFPLSENNHRILKEKKSEGKNNLYRLKYFIKKFCNKTSGETCDLDEIKDVVKELPYEVGDLDNEIGELMRDLNLNGGKKKMKGGNPELLKNALHIIHKGVLTLKGKTREALQEALKALDKTIFNIFKIADHVINDFDAIEALTCVQLFMSTLIGEKLSKILESILIGAGAVSATMVGIQQAPQYVKYIPTILKYLATGGVVLTSSTVCFYIGDYLTNLSTLGKAKYEKLSEEGQNLINELAEKVQNSQNGDVELATIEIENYNNALKTLVTDLKPEDLVILTTIEKEGSMDVVTTEDEGDGEKEAANTEEEDAAATTTAADGEEEEEEDEDEDAAATTAHGVEEEEEDAAATTAHGVLLKRKREEREGEGEGEEEADESNKIPKNDDDNEMVQAETGGKKKKKGRTTQKKKKGTKGKKKASKSKKPKTKKNRKTKKKSNKK